MSNPDLHYLLDYLREEFSRCPDIRITIAPVTRDSGPLGSSGVLLSGRVGGRATL
jgi:hypothetical protein